MIQFNKIIERFTNGKIEDFFVCDCVFDDLFSFLFSIEKMTYNDITSKLQEKNPNGFLFLNFYDASILMCKYSFLYYRKIRKNNFVKEGCCPEFLKIDGEVTVVCYICLLKDILVNLNLDFFTHFKLVDRFRSNGLYLYLQLPIRTSTENVLL